MRATRTTRRRTTIALVLVLLMVCGLVYKLFDVQVVQASALDAQAAEKRGDTIVLHGARGDIVADDGTVLAGSGLRYDFIATPINAVSAYTNSKGFALPRDQALAKLAADPVMAKLSAIAKIPVSTFMDDIDAAFKINPKSQYAPLITDADVPTFNAIQKLDIAWLTPVSHPDRTYPDGAVGGNIVGYVNGGGIGAEGLEQEYNKCLTGSDGAESYLSARDDGVAIPGSLKVTKKPKQGGTLETTLDPDLTWFANQNLAATVPALGAQFGQITVADVKTGDIKVAAQWPSVDPNNVDGAPAKYRSTAMMFSDMFEPGSTMKALTAASMIDTGYATPNSRVTAGYEFRSGNGADLFDNEYHAPQNMTLTGILMNSSNTGISILGRNMSDQVRYDYYKKFGIGTPTGVDFPAEASGIISDPKTWDDQTKYATMFGQGLAATQAQMVGAYQAIANGGVKVPLSLVKGCRLADGTLVDQPKKTPTRVIKASTSKTVLDMLESVVQQGPISSLVKIPGYRMSVKTGTAQESNGQGGYYNSYYVSVMGIAPVDNPQYVVSVNIGYPTTIMTSAAAAPLFKTMMSQVLKTYRVSPSTSKPTMYPPYW